MCSGIRFRDVTIALSSLCAMYETLLCSLTYIGERIVEDVQYSQHNTTGCLVKWLPHPSNVTGPYYWISSGAEGTGKVKCVSTNCFRPNKSSATVRNGHLGITESSLCGLGGKMSFIIHFSSGTSYHTMLRCRHKSLTVQTMSAYMVIMLTKHRIVLYICQSI